MEALFPSQDEKLRRLIVKRAAANTARGEPLDTGFSDLEERVLRGMLDAELAAQANLHAVVVAMQHRLEEVERKALPATSASDNSDEPKGGEAATDPEFISRFRSYAREVTTERMQQVWGRILAGEVARPGSYSLRTLEVLRKLDREAAGTFERAASFIIEMRWLPVDFEQLDQAASRTPPHYQISHAYNELGFPLVERIDLQDAGLLGTTSGFLSPPRRADAQFWFVADQVFRVGGLLKGGERSLRVLPLTRAGRELLPVVSFARSDHYFCAITNLVCPIGAHVDRRQLGRCVDMDTFNEADFLALRRQYRN